MAESLTPRLMAAAKKFNIGKDTLVDLLIGKGFRRDDLQTTSKLTDDMYRSLQQEFNSDKAAKIKSDQIDLPKGAVAENKKNKDEEEIVFKKEGAKKTIPATPAPAAVVEEKPVVVEVQPEIVKVEAPEIEGPKVLDKIDLSTIDSSTRPKKTL